MKDLHAYAARPSGQGKDVDWRILSVELVDGSLAFSLSGASRKRTMSDTHAVEEPIQYIKSTPGNFHQDI